MKREIIEKTLVTLVLVACFVWMPKIGYSPHSGILSHYLYLFSHVNVWHLAGNLFVLWLMRGKLYLPSSIVIAIMFSMLPALGSIWDRFSFDEVTMGFSGVLFAMVGTKWGYYAWRNNKQAETARRFAVKVIPFALIGVLIPHINWCLHLYCLLAGYFYGCCRR